MLSQLGTMAMDACQVKDAMTPYSQALDIAAESGQRAATVRLYGRPPVSPKQGDLNAAMVALEQQSKSQRPSISRWCATRQCNISHTCVTRPTIRVWKRTSRPCGSPDQLAMSTAKP